MNMEFVEHSKRGLNGLIANESSQWSTETQSQSVKDASKALGQSSIPCAVIRQLNSPFGHALGGPT